MNYLINNLRKKEKKQLMIYDNQLLNTYIYIDMVLNLIFNVSMNRTIQEHLLDKFLTGKKVNMHFRFPC